MYKEWLNLDMCQYNTSVALKRNVERRLRKCSRSIGETRMPSMRTACLYTETDFFGCLLSIVVKSGVCVSGNIPYHCILTHAAKGRFLHLGLLDAIMPRHPTESRDGRDELPLEMPRNLHGNIGSMLAELCERGLAVRISCRPRSSSIQG